MKTYPLSEVNNDPRYSYRPYNKTRRICADVVRELNTTIFEESLTQHFINKCELVERLIDFEVEVKSPKESISMQRFYREELFDLIMKEKELQNFVIEQLSKQLDISKYVNAEVDEKR